MQTVIDLSEIYNQAGRVYCCNKGNESPVCYADKYTQRIRARALYHDFGFSAPLNSDSEGTKNRLLVIGRYSAHWLVLHSRVLSESVTILILTNET